MSEAIEAWADLDEGFDLDDYEAKIGSAFVRVPKGIYKAIVTNVEAKKSKKDVPNVVFEYTILEGEFKDSTYQEWIQFTEKGKHYIKGRYVSLGCDDAPGTKYRRDDVLDVEVTLVLKESANPEDPKNPYINVDTVAVAGSGTSEKKEAPKEKKSGGNLFG